MQIVAFTKSFRDLSIPEVCRAFRALGLDGLDLTVRPGGHIDPADAERELPRAVEAAQQEGLTIPFITTAITDPNPEAERVLKAAADVGIRRFKMGYYPYQEFGALARQLGQVRQRIRAVCDLAARFNILPCVHIHSGSSLPSHGTQCYELLRDIPPERVGAYVDTLHMVREGSGDGWRQGLDLLGPWIQLVAVKNFALEPAGRDELGQQQWNWKVVPVADGVSQIPEFVAALKKLGYDGTYSLHSEYQGGHSFRDLSTQECLQQTADDLKFLRRVLGAG